MRKHSDRIHISTISVVELVQGVAQLRHRAAHDKADGLDIWLGTMLRRYRRRTLTLDVRAASDAGRLMALARARGHTPSFADLAIAGIALANGLTLLTRNLRHFAPLGVPAHDPYASLPD